jgi:hypothetical protein
VPDVNVDGDVMAMPIAAGLDTPPLDGDLGDDDAIYSEDGPS